ncbi:MAG: hypothetical protein GY822_27100 [Deltaproteobacteria bacterium]|nr:hypothetical protein [Deltaproteobacteria bacterium]
MIPTFLHEDGFPPFDVVYCSDPLQEEGIVAAGTGTCDGISLESTWGSRKGAVVHGEWPLGPVLLQAEGSFFSTTVVDIVDVTPPPMPYGFTWSVQKYWNTG